MAHGPVDGVAVAAVLGEIRLLLQKTDALAAFPKGTPEQKLARDAAVLEATKRATLVPLEVLKMVPDALSTTLAVAQRGNKNSASDAGVAAGALRTAAEGAWLNVRINLGSISDDAFKKQVRDEGLAALAAARLAAGEVERVVAQSIG